MYMNLLCYTWYDTIRSTLITVHETFFLSICVLAKTENSILCVNLACINFFALIAASPYPKLAIETEQEVKYVQSWQ